MFIIYPIYRKRPRNPEGGIKVKMRCDMIMETKLFGTLAEHSERENTAENRTALIFRPSISPRNFPLE